MSKEIWKPGNMIFPLPAVLVTVSDNEGNDNVLTVAWTGTICTNRRWLMYQYDHRDIRIR